MNSHLNRMNIKLFVFFLQHTIKRLSKLPTKPCVECYRRKLDLQRHVILTSSRCSQHDTFTRYLKPRCTFLAYLQSESDTNTRLSGLQRLRADVNKIWSNKHGRTCGHGVFKRFIELHVLLYRWNGTVPSILLNWVLEHSKRTYDKIFTDFCWIQLRIVQ